ncbi:MAG: ATPase, T2SS/T4P/T4SS family, partial [Opitutales bacterium]
MIDDPQRKLPSSQNLRVESPEANVEQDDPGAPSEDPSIVERPDWLKDVAETDLYGILEAPREDRVRLLAASRSKSVDEVLIAIAEQVELPVMQEFELAESPTKYLPLRIIHQYCCLPVNDEAEDKLSLVTPWPPTDRMSRWVFAVSGRKPLWYLGHPEAISRSITENFGIGADSLEDSDLALDLEEEEDDVEDQNAAIIRFVNEVILRAVVDRATDIHFEPRKETLQIRYRIDGQLVPVRVPDNLRSFQDAIISRIKIMAGINISEKRR